MKRLQDRGAIVFGAGSIGEGWGNGKAAAVAYAREGAKIVCVDRNGPAASALTGQRRHRGSPASLRCA